MLNIKSLCISVYDLHVFDKTRLRILPESMSFDSIYLQTNYLKTAIYANKLAINKPR